MMGNGYQAPNQGGGYGDAAGGYGGADYAKPAGGGYGGGAVGGGGGGGYSAPAVGGGYASSYDDNRGYGSRPDVGYGGARPAVDNYSGGEQGCFIFL